MSILQTIDDIVLDSAETVARKYNYITGGGRGECAAVILCGGLSVKTILAYESNHFSIVDAAITSAATVIPTVSFLCEDKKQNGSSELVHIEHEINNQRNRDFGYGLIGVGVFFGMAAGIECHAEMTRTLYDIGNGVFMAAAGYCYHILRTPHIPPGKNIFSRVTEAIKNYIAKPSLT